MKLSKITVGGTVAGVVLACIGGVALTGPAGADAGFEGARYAVAGIDGKPSARTSSSLSLGARSIVQQIRSGAEASAAGPLAVGNVRSYTTTVSDVKVDVATNGDDVCWTAAVGQPQPAVNCTRASVTNPNVVSYEIVSAGSRSWVVGVAPEGIPSVAATATDGTESAAAVSNSVVVVPVRTAQVAKVSWTSPDGAQHAETVDNVGK